MSTKLKSEDSLRDVVSSLNREPAKQVIGNLVYDEVHTAFLKGESITIKIVVGATLFYTTPDMSLVELAEHAGTSQQDRRSQIFPINANLEIGKRTLEKLDSLTRYADGGFSFEGTDHTRESGEGNYNSYYEIDTYIEYRISVACDGNATYEEKSRRVRG